MDNNKVIQNDYLIQTTAGKISEQNMETQNCEIGEKINESTYILFSTIYRINAL